VGVGNFSFFGFDAVMKLHKQLAALFHENHSTFVRAGFVNGLPGFIRKTNAGHLLSTAGLVTIIDIPRGTCLLLWGLVLAAMPISVADAADETAVVRQSLDDAWWTGPLLAASPATLPQGHALIEPYVFDSINNGQYDSRGGRHATPRENDFGSLTYLLYGLTDAISTGVIPRFGYNEPSQGPSSSSIGVGDITLQGSFRLSRFLDRGWLPAMALVVGETLPAGRYDRLGNRPSDGLGAGAYTTTVSLYSQYYLWMPNGRILRTRLDISQAWSNEVGIMDTSVYGTTQGFRGHANPGNSLTIDSAWEYSLTRHWVAAIDVAYVDSGSTRLQGYYPQSLNGGALLSNVDTESGSSQSLSLAPAVEYNWSSTVGVIVGAKWVAAGRNTSASIIPVAAINLVF
jgi:hypothetical protein